MISVLEYLETIEMKRDIDDITPDLLIVMYVKEMLQKGYDLEDIANNIENYCKLPGAIEYFKSF